MSALVGGLPSVQLSDWVVASFGSGWSQPVDVLAVGDHVFLDDGLIVLEVTAREAAGLRCRVRHGGLLHGRKGISAPAASVALPAFTDKDRADLDLGLALGVDWVAVSFVRSAADLQPVRERIAAAGADTPILAKIERREAVANLDEIVAAADGILIARGDLGIELPLHEVPVVQKQIIARCNDLGKPVITATQMLESMTRNPMPTRAEVSDVANAIFDGTDAVMLSAETAIGEFPIEATRTMAQIAEWTEAHLDYVALLERRLRHHATTITDAISQGAAEIAADLDVRAILCSTSSGTTARMVSRMRPRAPIVAATTRAETARRLCLVWGVQPLLVPYTQETDAMLRSTVEGARRAGWVAAGDLVVIASGVHIGSPGGTNLIKVERVEAAT